MIQLLHVF
ncbi:unnamed protein product [Acanthoscelides obtectus]|uniref:Uncharacterized protein n=1 Tax=Acanthoscelides obtectus TaxID=200917 RepID=A0A9P0LZQ4_ACAOB|nr:unnamed protein product [Acanthoscelides obtectus]CAK1655711.1 hypothetical protein AOBTE_LOCUS19276 [Acanthoscelides obtectus]